MLITWVGGVCVLSYLAMILREVFPRSRGLGALILAFFLVAGALIGLGVFDPTAFPPPPIRFMIVLLIALGVSTRIPATRKVWESIPTERLILWHWVRAPIGIVFIISGIQGTLGPEFGARAGWGDLVAGAWALAYLAWPKKLRQSLFAWNLFAFADLVLAVATAGMTIQSPIQRYPHAELMLPLGELPLGLVPAFAVPTLFFTHFLIYRRLALRRS